MNNLETDILILKARGFARECYDEYEAMPMFLNYYDNENWLHFIKYNECENWRELKSSMLDFAKFVANQGKPRQCPQNRSEERSPKLALYQVGALSEYFSGNDLPKTKHGGK